MKHPIPRRLLTAALPFILLLGGCKEQDDGGRPATQRQPSITEGESTSGTPSAAPAERADGHAGGGHAAPDIGTPASKSAPGTAGHADHQAASAPGTQPPPGYATVTIDPSRQQLIGLRTGQVTRRSFSQLATKFEKS